MYPTDITDEEWELIKELFKRRDNRGARAKHAKRVIVNAIFYVIKTGIQWRMLPKDFPPWQTVYDYFSQWKRYGVWDEALKLINQIHRKKKGKNLHQAMES